MACYTVIKLDIEIKGSAEEIINTLKVMGKNPLHNIYTYAEYINFSGGSFKREKDNWSISLTQPSSFDLKYFQREFQRTKILTVAKQKGYKVLENKEKNGVIQIMLSTG